MIEITTTHELTTEDILDILTTAIEGGIGYWACLRNDYPEWKKAREQLKAENKEIYYDTIAWRVLENNDCITLEDEEEDTMYQLTKEKFLSGCQQWMEKEGKDLHKCLNHGSFDAWDADAIIQYALFNEIVFG